MSKTPEPLVPALRQYRSNDGSEGFIIAYDKEEAEKALARLARYADRLREDLEEYHAQYGEDCIAKKYGMGWALSLPNPMKEN
ncbi:hypothetical protein [Salinisphaera sp. G21_0]|uniref:hypothetical protein n=1 Tax=Salinisphaera sp. G21_0 TaxID=2821094 RepID=UPI001ADB1BC6|nr:hypothetical protein [Salinisphaera sp. G21_0]MBO9484323.1 hypothetical protein [Salinisphaera sp. G21_0]